MKVTKILDYIKSWNAIVAFVKNIPGILDKIPVVLKLWTWVILCVATIFSAICLYIKGKLIPVLILPLMKLPENIKLWYILVLILIITFVTILSYKKKYKWYKSSIEKEIKWRWSYNKFKQIILDFPPYCTKDNQKLQIDNRKIPPKEFICPKCLKSFSINNIYSSYKITKKSIKKKYENYYFYETLRKKGLHNL